MNGPLLKTGLDDWFGRKLGTRLALEALVVETIPSLGGEWGTPIPLEDLTGPPFPMEHLPTDMQAYAEAVTRDTGAPLDLVVWVMLGTISAATRGRYVVSPKSTWREPAILQTAQIVASGGGKSPAYAAITRPLVTWEERQRVAYKEDLQRWQVKHKSLSVVEKKAQREAEKPQAADDAMLGLEAVQLDILKNAEAKPILQSIMVNDLTPAALWKFLFRQGGSAAAISPEGEFFRNAYRYSDAPIWEPFLKGFSGDPHDLKRAGDDDDDGLSIPRVILTICVAMQQQVMEDLGQQRGFDGLGVLARLLTTFPTAAPTARTLTTPVPSALQEAWEQRMLRIAEGGAGSAYAPIRLPLSVEAAEVFAEEYAWYADAELAGVFLDMEEWGRKYRGQVLRVAGQLHVFESDQPHVDEMSGQNMARAIGIMRPAIEHARIAHGIVLGLGTQSRERYVLTVIDELFAASPDSVSSADIYDRVRGRHAFRKSERLLQVLRSLEEHRYVRLTRREGPGPRTYTVERNPLSNSCDIATSPFEPAQATAIASDTPHLRIFAGDPKGSADDALENLRTFPDLLAPTGTDGDVREY
jgi:hypothetical protein